jgi:RNA polymerase-binding protein DksA
MTVQQTTTQTTTAEKAPPTKAPAKKAPAEKAPAKTAPPKKASAKTAPAKKAPAKKAPAKAPASKTAPAKGRKATATTAPPSAKPVKKAPAKKAPAEKAPAKAPAKKAPAKKAAKKTPEKLSLPPVPAGDAWTEAELVEVRVELVAQLEELRAEYSVSIAEIEDLQSQANDGAGDDQADAGTKTFEREQEMSIANNRFDLLTQTERAIERIDAGTYGRCESCGNPIAKARLQAFPSATLCVTCKQREERR